jgi:2-C-methyl-D-erythritol 2,4-cyclodiphosphate synthase
VDVRIGTGYDLHRFADGRPLILAGVYLKGERGLAGHSDADVVTHAIVDAMLGAAGLGDMGTHFPSSDERWAGADSRDFLRGAIAMLAERGWRTVNVDATVIAERPRLGPLIPAMRASLARTLGMAEDSVSVKAKSNDGVGALGAGEAIAALAAALIARGD